MQVRLHANATTTPRTRAYIQASTASVTELARELGVSETTIRRWRPRTGVADGSHVPIRLATSLTDFEQRLVVELRTALELPLDDIVEVMRRCMNPKLSRSAIHRCLKRHAVSARPKPAKRQVGSFEEAGVGFIHVDLKHLTRLDGQPSFVFVAIDRATRFVHIENIERRDAVTVAACLERFLAAFPHKVHTILTDNGAEFTDRFGAARWSAQRRATGRHAFDRVCAGHRIEHRLIRPFRPQTNGLVERFNRRLAEAIRARASVARNEGKNKFLTRAERDAFLLRFVADYNRTRLKCLDYRAPAQLLLNPPGPNTQAGTQTPCINTMLHIRRCGLGSRLRGNDVRGGNLPAIIPKSCRDPWSRAHANCESGASRLNRLPCSRPSKASPSAAPLPSASRSCGA